MIRRSAKRTYLVAYDYGKGGLWGFIRACSAREITERYPELVVVRRRPPWITRELLRQLREIELHDIYDAPSGFSTR